MEVKKEVTISVRAAKNSKLTAYRLVLKALSGVSKTNKALILNAAAERLLFQPKPRKQIRTY